MTRQWLLAIVGVCLSSMAVGGAEPRRVVVAQDGSGQFTSVAAAVASVKDATAQEPVEVFVKAGTYFERWHNWYAQKGPCSMTLERCSLKAEDWAIGIYNLGSGQRDFFVLHDCVLSSPRAGIQYANQRNVQGQKWNGQNETELVGSGNTMPVIHGTQMKDDSDRRRSGIELAKSGGAATKP